MRRQRIWVAASGASVLVLALVVAAVAHVNGGAGPKTSEAASLPLAEVSAAQVLTLRARSALPDSLWDGWSRQSISGVGFLTLPPELPPAPDMLGTTPLFAPGIGLGGLQRMSSDLSWLGRYGNEFKLASVGGAFTFRPPNGLGGGPPSWAPGASLPGTGPGGGSGGGTPVQPGLPFDPPGLGGDAPPTPDPAGPPQDTGGGNAGPDPDAPPEEVPVVFDPPAEPVIDPPDPPDIDPPTDPPGNNGDPTVPNGPPGTSNQPAEVAAVPEPGMLALFSVALGLLGIGAFARRHRG